MSFAFQSSAPERSALMSFAFQRSASVSSAFQSSAPERCAPMRSAPVRSAPGANRQDRPSGRFLGGREGWALFSIFCVRPIAPVRVAPPRYVPVRVASVRFAPERSASVRSASVRSASVSFTPDRLIPAGKTIPLIATSSSASSSTILRMARLTTLIFSSFPVSPFTSSSEAAATEASSANWVKS